MFSPENMKYGPISIKLTTTPLFTIYSDISIMFSVGNRFIKMFVALKLHNKTAIAVTCVTVFTSKMLTGPVLAVAAAGELAAGRGTDRPGGGGGGGRRGVQAADALPLPPSPAYHAQVRSNFKT